MVVHDTGRISLASMDLMALASKQMQESTRLTDTSDPVQVPWDIRPSVGAYERLLQ